MKNLSILIIGGDARYLEVIDTFSKKGANLFLAGFDRLSFDGSNITNSNLDKIDLLGMDAILLPVSGTSQTGKVELAPYSKHDIFLTPEIVQQTPNHCMIYTGISNAFLDKLGMDTNRNLVRLFARDDLAILNSIPTAEGVLQLAIEHTDYTIHGAQVMVFGFGRVGMTVARLFSKIGANVSVFARRNSDLARVVEMGMNPIRKENLVDYVSGIDICINTIPSLIIDSNTISAMHKSTLILDIASPPGGTDFSFAAEQGIKTIHALGLPGKTAPRSAGKIIADVFEELLKDSH